MYHRKTWKCALGYNAQGQTVCHMQEAHFSKVVCCTIAFIGTEEPTTQGACAPAGATGRRPGWQQRPLARLYRRRRPCHGSCPSQPATRAGSPSKPSDRARCLCTRDTSQRQRGFISLPPSHNMECQWSALGTELDVQLVITDKGGSGNDSTCRGGPSASSPQVGQPGVQAEHGHARRSACAGTAPCSPERCARPCAAARPPRRA